MIDKKYNGELRIHNDTMYVDLWYPEVDGNPKYVDLDLMHVRAADSIRIHYDFERDGWAIEQASTFSWPSSDPECDPDWQEVAFVQAWAREKPDQPHQVG